MILALDTSTLTLSLALVARETGGLRALEVFTEGPPRKQSEMLPGVISELLDRHGVKLSDLEGLAWGMGPGSFTGLRIGLATVKALAYALKSKVASVSSLAAIAYEGPIETPLLSCVVARQNEVYVGQYLREGNELVTLAPDSAMSPKELLELAVSTPNSFLLGPAVGEYQSFLQENGLTPNRMSAAPKWPSALSIAALARFSDAFDAQTLFALEPQYVKASGAERNPKFPPLPGPEPQARIREEE